jgi:aminopeptidase N
MVRGIVHILAASFAAFFMLAAMSIPLAAAQALHRPAQADLEDSHRLLWEPKQRAFERLQEALALPPDADRASQDDFDVTFYDIDITIDPSAERVDGVVTMEATSVVDGLSTVILNLFDNMSVTSVTDNLTPLAYTHSNHRITVTLAESIDAGAVFKVTVAYGGYPVNNALKFNYHSGNVIASSLSEPNGSREWWPCKDTPADKADSVRIAFTVPDFQFAASEGILVSTTDNGNGTITYEWFERYPITTYLVSVASTNYETFTEYYHYSPTDSMPIDNYVYPEHYDDALIDLSITADALGFMASIYGEYPFIEEKYGHAEFPWGGAMEHQTCTSYGAILFTGTNYYDWVLIHEAAHQWWGDWVTCRTWDDIWLNEGFATYTEALWFEYLDGFEAYVERMEGYDSQGYFDGPIYDPDQTFGRTVYKKGAWVLHMLRRVVGGRDTLLEILDTYGAAHEYGTAITSEFQEAAESIHGESLDWFFQEWVYGENRPSYLYDWTWSGGDDTYNVMLNIQQNQTNAGLFTMPIDIVVETVAGDTTVTVWNDQWDQNFFFTVDSAPVDLHFDPDSWILKYLDIGTGIEMPEQVTTLSLAAASNPFRESARLVYSLPSAGRVRLAVYDVSGRLVRELVDADAPAGVHEAVWPGVGRDGNGVASGIYFARLTTDAGTASEKLLFVK